jgi:NarL family two-component system response regulator YdfI
VSRIAIVATSEELRAALASTLRSDPSFDVVSVVASETEVTGLADIVLVAHDADDADIAARPLHHDLASGPTLSNREREILALLADGLGNKQIAARLGISTNTVKTHLELLFEKLGVSSRAEAVATGVRRGLLML